MPRHYADNQVKQGLAIWHLSSGKPSRVKEMLKEREIGIPFETIRQWVQQTRKEESEQVKTEVTTLVHSRLESQFTELADTATEVSRKALSELWIRTEPEEIMEMKTQDVLKILHEAGVAADIAMDQALKLGGKPTQIVRMDFGELQRALKERHGISLSIPGEVVGEETVAELEEST